VTSGTRARSGQTELHPELARHRRQRAGVLSDEDPHGSVTHYPPGGVVQRRAAEMRELAGGRRQAGAIRR
jgi:hypothetical protein